MKILLKIYLVVTALSLASYLGLSLVAFLWWGGFDYSDFKTVLETMGIVGIPFNQLVIVAIVGSVLFFVRMNLVQAFIKGKEIWSKTFWKAFFLLDIIGGVFIFLQNYFLVDLIIISIGWVIYYQYLFKKPVIQSVQ